MKDAGYTLADTLMALAILALAIGGLTSGLQVLARQQRSVSGVVSDVEAVRAAQAKLDRLLVGPYGSNAPDRFTGDAQSFRFDCGQQRLCTAELRSGEQIQLQISDQGGDHQLRLPTTGPIHLVYVGSLGPSATWPPSRPERQTLTSVGLVRDNDPAQLAVLKGRVWREQPLSCEFDPVLQDCR